MQTLSPVPHGHLPLVSREAALPSWWLLLPRPPEPLQVGCTAAGAPVTAGVSANSLPCRPRQSCLQGPPTPKAPSPAWVHSAVGITIFGQVTTQSVYSVFT